MNLGLTNSLGEYIGVVEPDDFVEKDMFEKLYTAAKKNNLDLAKSNYYGYSEHGNEYRGIFDKFIYNKVICANKTPGILLCPPTIWAAIYRKKFLEEMNIGFLETPGASYQDTSFTFKSMMMAKRIMLLPKACYHYRLDNPLSSVNQSESKVFCVCDEYMEIESYINRHAEIPKKLVNYEKAMKFMTYNWNYNKERLRITLSLLLCVQRLYRSPF